MGARKWQPVGHGSDHLEELMKLLLFNEPDSDSGRNLNARSRQKWLSDPPDKVTVKLRREAAMRFFLQDY